MSETTRADVLVIGGGVGGLAAATYAARAGKRVTLVERSRTLGGRAATQETAGFHLNLGPHALYRRGAGAAALRELGIRFSGGLPSASGAYAIDGGTKQTLPAGFVSLLTTGLLRLPGKLETARLLGTIQRIDADAAQGVSVRDWLARAIRQPDVRALVQALFRLSTYANDPDRQSAGSAIAQLQMALAANVTYVDGGWQVLVDGLRDAARAAGATIVTGTRALAVEHDGPLHAVRLEDGTCHTAAAVILAVTPAEAAALVPASRDLAAWAANAIAVRAACLDVALSHLPVPRARFALGIDRPLYCSVHSAVARLAPEGGATIHVARYLPPGASDARADERELEALLDSMQPGWRAVVVERRFLPSMVVSNALVTAAAMGTAGRPGPAVPGLRRCYVVGDWVGPEGQLVDASLASARRAAAMAVRDEAVASVAAA